MGRYDAETQTWWWRSKWINTWNWFYICTKIDISLDIYRQREAAGQSLVGMLSLLLLTEDGVHEQHFPSVHIRRELGVVHFGFLCLLVTLDKDLADPDGAAAVAESLLHGLTWVEAGSVRLAGALDALPRWNLQKCPIIGACYAVLNLREKGRVSPGRWH